MPIATASGLVASRKRLGAGNHFLMVEVEQVLVEPLHAAFAGARYSRSGRRSCFP